MSKKASHRAPRVRDVEPGIPFVMHSAELIASPAWKARSIHCARLLDRLELEICAHAGHENGYLIVTYDQFVEYGIGRRFVRLAIEEAVELGLAEVTRQGLYRGGSRRQPNLYRLTYLKSKFVPTAGAPYFLEPSHEWRAFKAKAKRRKSSRLVTMGEPSKFTTGELKRRSPEQTGIATAAGFLDRH